MMQSEDLSVILMNEVSKNDADANRSHGAGVIMGTAPECSSPFLHNIGVEALG